ncbi:hypothetical protein AB9X41_21535, partial [Ralstonia solanacearum]|uniref:hypothetical protein n=1 Tax=Ralstonia solanacearum TaxID=305 RepID=UPI00351680FC
NLQDDCANMHVSCNSDNTVSVAKPCVSRLRGLFRADYVEHIDLTDFPFVQCDRYFTHEFSYFFESS